MAAIDVVANTTRAEVTSGGTTAPSSGTVEDWTVIEATAFPAIGTEETQQYRVIDLVDLNKTVPNNGSNGGYEAMLVTERSSDSSWVVTRGAEGTTPWAHAPNWTALLSNTAGGMNNAFLALGSTISGGNASSTYS